MMQKLLLVIWVAVLAGCMTKYEITKQTPEGDVKVLVQSFREFEQPQVSYSRDGDTVTFSFGAESATTATSPIEEAVARGIETGAVLVNPVPKN